MLVSFNIIEYKEMNNLIPAISSSILTERTSFSTVSPQLNAFIAESSIIGEPTLKSAETWRLIQGFYEKATWTASETAKTQYIESFEETVIAGVPALFVTPKNMPLVNQDKIIVYLHGGGFTLGSPKHLFQVFSYVAYETGVKVLAVDYGLAPENPFPVALNQCFEIYQELLKDFDSNKIVFLGDSAGGNLCLATTLMAKEKGVPLPKALALFSPVTDAKKGDSYEKNRDPRISYESTIEPSFMAYCQDVENPFYTILNADLGGLPDIFTQTGSRDALESDSIRLEAAVTLRGGNITCVSLPGVPHGIVEQSEDLIPESREAKQLAAEFIKGQLGL